MLCSDTAVARNAERAALTSEHQTRQQMLSRELQQLNRSHRTEVSNRLFSNHLIYSSNDNNNNNNNLYVKAEWYLNGI